MKPIDDNKSSKESKKFKTIDEYHHAFPVNICNKLDELRKTIKQVAPQAEEIISYNMPAFKLNGVLVFYAAYKKHIGFYPTASPIAIFKEELSAYKTSKGAIQFPIDQPFPRTLIKKMVKFRVEEDLKKVKVKKKTLHEHLHYHKDGSIRAVGNMHGDQMHGYWKWYRKGGVIMRSGYFDKGKQVGEWTTYNSEGKIYKVTVMSKNQENLS